MKSVFRVLDEIVPAYQQSGYVRERMGADTVQCLSAQPLPDARRQVDRDCLLKR